MEIIIEPHKLKRALERGATKEEIINVLDVGFVIPAKSNRFAKAKIFDYNNYWNNKYYEQKRIEVIYTIEDVKIVTITVYVFYGKWE
ncbi:MAG: hypothetical protein HW421_2537 [Ignavibacteria bacterium]|nr:hypothetical protein [Ignavibacteria bacterium]